MVHRLVTKVEGRITADNIETGGVLFRISLPVTAENIATKAPVAPSALLTDEQSILIVDDDKTVRDLLKLMVSDICGSSVKVCCSGKEALDILEKETFDAIILDVRMPGMSGREVFERFPDWIKKRVVFITGDTLNSNTTRFMNDIKQPFLLKPFDKNDLCDAISSVIKA